MGLTRDSFVANARVTWWCQQSLKRGTGAGQKDQPYVKRSRNSTCRKIVASEPHARVIVAAASHASTMVVLS
jgi:hypothetical protein